MTKRRFSLIVPAVGLFAAVALSAGSALADGPNARPRAPLSAVSFVITDTKIAPAAVTFKKGKSITVTAANRSASQQTFTVKKLGINFVLEPEETAEKTIKPKKAGKFTAISTINPSLKAVITVK